MGETADEASEDEEEEEDDGPLLVIEYLHLEGLHIED